MTTVDTYKHYSDSPGTLLSGYEWEKLSNEKTSSDPLPKGWPKKLEGPLVWTGKSLQENPDSFLYVLSDDDRREIDAAIKSYNLPLDQVSQETFKLPTLGPKLLKFSKELYFGNGVRVIRGFARDDYNKKEATIAFLGISSYIGEVRDAQGLNRALTHIKSIAHIPKDKRAPIGVSQQTTDPQMFHNDLGGDIVSLFVQDIPVSGGASLVTSGYTVYNELASTRPDLLNTLASETWKFKGANPEGNSLVHYIDDRYFTQFSTRGFIGFGELSRDETYPEINDQQRDALGAYHWIGFKNGLVHELEKGDIEYVNNLFLQHSRLGYTEDDKNRRHVSRLWLRNLEHSNSIKKPRVIEDKIKIYFPTNYKQEIPLDELEEDLLKIRAGVDSLDKIYAPPKQ